MIRTLLSLILALAASSAAAQEQPLTGTLRITGISEMAPVLAAWTEVFEQQNPRIHVAPSLRGPASAQYGLEMRTAGIALLDRPLNPFELYGTYERSWIYPVAIELGTAGAYGIYVHPANPLRQLSVEQLDGIFGAQRDGGWDRLSWMTSAARGADRNLRNWRQLGLKAGPIHVYAPPSQAQGAITAWQQVVLQGGAMRNEDTREYDDPAALFAALKADPLGIAYAEIGTAPAGLVPLAIAPRGGGDFVAPGRASIAERRYPLATPLYAYFTRDDARGDPAPVPAAIRAMLRLALSPAGQAALARNPRFNPLPQSRIAGELAKVNSDDWPAERPRP